MADEPNGQMRGERVSIAVLVPTYRRVKDLERCLTALGQQRRTPDRVVLVCRETDLETSDFLAARSNGDLPIEVVKVTSVGLIAALNAGLDRIEADIVCITDDDAAPRPEWLTLIERHFETHPEVGAVGGRDHVHGEATRDHEESRVGRFQWFGRVVGNHHRGQGPARAVQFLKGVNMSYRMAAIGKARFDHRLRGSGAQIHNDLAFSLSLRRSGWVLLYDPAVAVDHFPAQRFDEDQRHVANYRTIEDRAYNETLTILEHLSSVQRPAFALWVLLVGTRELPGVLHCLRFPPTNPPGWKRLSPVFKGRLAAWRVARKPRDCGWNLRSIAL